jgi:ankyrin repeat protein
MPTQCAFDFDAPPTPSARPPQSRPAPGSTPHAAASAYLPIAEALLAHGAPADVQARGGTTPLHLAAYVNDLAFAGLLLAHGAAPDTPLALWRSTPAHIAASRGSDAMLDLLYRHGACRHARDAHGRTPTALLLSSRDTSDTTP